MFNAEGVVKLIDFGFAKYQEIGQEINDLSGTPYFIAPEVLKGKYGRECDVWSLGVVLFLVLTGERPFSGKTAPELYGRINMGKFEFPKGSSLSPQAQDLIKRMITVDVNKRITFEEALAHPWFTRTVRRKSVVD